MAIRLKVGQPRQCGTCRFYQPSPLEGAGWCRNLLRVGRDDLVLVRRWELACKNGWGKDDWQPKDPHRHYSEPNNARGMEQAGTPPRFQSTVRPEDVEPSPVATPMPRQLTSLQPRPPGPDNEQPHALSRDSLLPDDPSVTLPHRQDPEEIRRRWRQEALSEHPGKRCANCAFFVPTAPGRGTCHNRFAFETDATVAADDLSCLSSLGHWWQPRSHLLLKDTISAELPKRP